jgi:magnesium chelatase subunit D
LICVEEIELETLQVTGSRAGRKRTPQAASTSGRFVRAVPVDESERDFDIAPDATLRAALIRQSSSGSDKPFRVVYSDLRKKVYLRPQKTLIVFVVDTSDSMGDGAYARIKSAKGAVLAILAKAYQKRHRVGLVAFRDEWADVVLQPTSSLPLARQQLKALPTGGATPFADGLMKAWRLVKTERLKDPGVRPLLVILSDGEANVPYDPKLRLREVMTELFLIAERIGSDNISSIAIDTRPLHQPNESMRKISQLLGGTYHHIGNLKTAGMVRAVAEF